MPACSKIHKAIRIAKVKGATQRTNLTHVLTLEKYLYYNIAKCGNRYGKQDGDYIIDQHMRLPNTA